MIAYDLLQANGVRVDSIVPGELFTDYCGDELMRINHPDDTAHMCHAVYVSGVLATHGASGVLATYCASALVLAHPRKEVKS